MPERPGSPEELTLKLPGRSRIDPAPAANDRMLIPAASAVQRLHFSPRCFLLLIVDASFLTP